MFPELGSYGPFTFYAFGLMVALAAVIPGWFMTQDLRARGMEPGAPSSCSWPAASAASSARGSTT